MFRFLSNNFPSRPKKVAIFFKKLVFWYILTTFSCKHDSLALFFPNYETYSSKNKVSKNFEKHPTASKNFTMPLQKHGGKDDPVLSFAATY